MKRLLIWYRFRGYLIFVFAHLVSFLTLLVAKNISLSGDYSVVLANLLNYFAIICLFAIIEHFRLTRFVFFHKINGAQSGRSCLTGIVSYFTAMSAVLLTVGILQSIFGSRLPAWFTASNDGFALFLGSPNDFIRILWILIIVAIGPFVEELLFRGFLQNALGHTVRYEFWAIVITAVVFALFHYNSFANMIFALIVGLILSVVRFRTNNLVLTTIVHGTVNAVSLTVGIILLQYVQ